MKRTDWQECPLVETGPGRWASYYATLNPEGKIAITRAMHERIGAPAACILLYDAATHRIGLRPCELSARNACRVRARGRHGGQTLNGRPLIREFHLEIAATLRFHDTYVDDEGVLVLDLRTARPSAASANHRHYGGKSADMSVART